MSRLKKEFLPLLADVGIMLLLVLLLGGGIVTDHSVTISGEGFLWNDVQYIPCTAVHTEGDTIAMTGSGWSVSEVEEDPSHTFLVLRSFLDQQLCVREDYEIPYDGLLRAVFWDGKKIEDDAFCAAVSQILTNFREERRWQTDAVFALTDTQRLRDVAFCWNDCPVGVDREDCWMGTLDGAWVFVKRVSGGEEESLATYAVYTVPAGLAAVLEDHAGTWAA